MKAAINRKSWIRWGLVQFTFSKLQLTPSIPKGVSEPALSIGAPGKPDFGLLG